MSRRKLEVNKKHCSYEELKATYRSCTDARLRTRILAVLQTWDGKPSTEVEQTSICLPPMSVNGYTDIMSKASWALKIPGIVTDPVFYLKNKSKK